MGYCQPKIDSLYDFLEAENTKAFILLKDGKIVLEKYFGTHTQSSVWQWASAGKTITSFMVGIAQQEGYLLITDTTSTYLGQGWTDCTPAQEEKITLRHQLTMTSGLDDGVADPFCTLNTCLVYEADAGTRWAYHNAPYTLLDGVIESATGVSLNSYTTQKLKSPTGMTGSFVSVGYNNVFFSNARSMARFGLLILNNGNWNGSQIMTDTAYFNQMVSTSQMLNQSYGYLWWLNGKPSYMLPQTQFVFPGSLCANAPSDMIVAMGKGGQFLNIVPSQNLVWLRMGDEPNNSLVPFLLNNDIWAYVNDLQCAYTITTSSNPIEGGTTTGGGSSVGGTNVTVTATANSGYTFTNWTENGNIVSTNTGYTFAVSANRNLVANFLNETNCNNPTPVISGNNISCNNSIQTYSVDAVVGDTYLWTVIGGTILSGQGTNSIQVQWNNATIGTVAVEQTTP